MQIRTQFRNFLLAFMLVPMLGAAPVWAQGMFKFEEETHVFDAIVEGEVANYDFKFKNVGNEPIIISHVQPACGCTAPSWTRDPVLPGKEGVISIAYNSAGRPGPYTKTVHVTSNGKPSAITLTFRGVVVKKPEDQAADAAAKANSPKMLLDKYSTKLGKMESGQTVTTKFVVKNLGKSPLQIKDIQSACMCTGYKLEKSEIGPNENTTLSLSYRAGKSGDVKEVVYISTNDVNSFLTKVTLEGTVVEEKLTPTSILKEGNSSVPFR